MELGFLERLRESPLWDRIGWFYGASAGALVGTMGALDRLDDLEEFMLRLQPEDTFRPHSLWRLPLLGSHDYCLPRTIEDRLGDVVGMARELAAGPIEVGVTVTDVTQAEQRSGLHAYELLYTSHTSPPEIFAQAVLASAAVSALVLPLPVGERVGTDGGWVRNFPLGHAYDQPGVELIVSFRYEPTYPSFGAGWLARIRRRLERFPPIPPVRALIAELVAAEEREARGEPAHWGDMIARLTRVSIQQNTVLEERVARDKDGSLAALRALREDIDRIVRREGGRHGERLAGAIANAFDAADFPFLGDRLVPRIAVAGGAGEQSLEAGMRTQEPWDEEVKRRLIERGYDLLDACFARGTAA
jgi:predicted acylesterase/phospholipase RssA